MKILFILEHYHPHTGGVEVLFKNLCEGLVAKGHEVEVVTSRLHDTKKEETLNGVKIRRIDVPQKMRRYFFTFFSIPYVMRVAHRYDIIQTTTYNGAFPAKLASLVSGKPAFITVHEILGKDWEIWGGMNKFSASLHRFLEWLIIRLGFQKYICVSRSTKNNLLKYNIKEDKVEVIHNGVDYDVFDSKKYDDEAKKIRKRFNMDKRFTFFFYGRPGGSKGFEYLLKAAYRVFKRIPDSQFIAVLGKRPEKRYEYFKKKIAEHPDNDRIILHEPLAYKDIPAYLKAADCIVVPSLTEGFGYCVAESCAMGKPVVASDTTSIPEVISGKYLLVEPKRPHSIAKAIVSVYKGKYKKTNLKKFRWKDNIKRYEELYDGYLLGMR